MSEERKAVITVVGQDRIGIIAGISRVLLEAEVSIIDISQTIMDRFFTMIMVADLQNMRGEMADLKRVLDQTGAELGVTVTLQDSRVFDAMHRL